MLFAMAEAIGSESLRWKGLVLLSVAQLTVVLDASIADVPSEPLAMGSELRGIALLNLGIVETWTGRLLEAERHLSDGAALAQRTGRHYLEVACRAHQGVPGGRLSERRHLARNMVQCPHAPADGGHRQGSESAGHGT